MEKPQEKAKSQADSQFTPPSLESAPALEVVVPQLSEAPSVPNEGHGDISLSLDLGTPSSSAPVPPPQLQTAPPTARPASGARGRRGAKTPLIDWDLLQLRGSGDPMGAGLAQLVEKGGVTSALFLAIMPPPPNSEIPCFLASAAIQPGANSALWEGFTLDPQVVPETWNDFVQDSFVEIGPQNREHVLRLALGIGPKDWLTLVSAGPLEDCRGMILLVSKQSVKGALATALPLLQTLPAAA